MPYAIAKLVHDAALKHRHVDLEQIWRSQTLSSALCNALTVAAERVNTVIIGDPLPAANPLVWAKQQACWNRVKFMEVVWPNSWYQSLLTSSDQHDEKKSEVKAQRMLNGIEAQMIVTKAGTAFWKAAQAWGEGTRTAF